MTEYVERDLSLKKVARFLEGCQLPVTINTTQVRHVRWRLASIMAPFTWVGFITVFLAALAHVHGRCGLRLRCLCVDAEIEGAPVIIGGSIDVELSVPVLPQFRFQAVSRNLDGIYLAISVSPFILSPFMTR